MIEVIHYFTYKTKSLYKTMAWMHLYVNVIVFKRAKQTQFWYFILAIDYLLTVMFMPLQQNK